MATTVSPDLLWAITRNSSSYVVKRGPVKDQVVFTKEPLNLVNKHTYKVLLFSPSFYPVIWLPLGNKGPSRNLVNLDPLTALWPCQ